MNASECVQTNVQIEIVMANPTWTPEVHHWLRLLKGTWDDQNLYVMGWDAQRRTWER
jgi:hypothetical protein